MEVSDTMMVEPVDVSVVRWMMEEEIKVPGADGQKVVMSEVADLRQKYKGWAHRELHQAQREMRIASNREFLALMQEVGDAAE